ncbi:MAG: tRNA (adenosine(37)-N6)-threonylcarbamoyltransferase complex ATPase subunit type 1 TsaE [Hydrogenophilales bacterium CG03_land_8_20_14_0_80_62_28]|nr:tRNA (adenosine(37)-N6)-threonylcarbamoyltransferase complex ATPase subunit type 1 TsaE [Betaproteobacteria bacterium]OIO76861.1 MAG: tRNA (adenosine(37)-N6)-threonylcarbamoyltransferase complex ATPase subunit type 1 TsaE [Hydrogenophilaceae bacterium CG1_02_62_390]PIV22279.1 MAG: tRNA (adenosine(37)-N6)-threonylcarbamoyltransferase complex ATPase subunit type 1 TsaE [Hydrogenophilales bacterium CG03_land_8_20_14_0_80_62_28]PIW39761.1 MAG: tRNA (adenosine(37)-N6)-threonylcarbamoyltransferase 
MHHVRDDSQIIDLPLLDEHATLDLGRRLASAVQPGMTIWLSGDLGAGKTTLTRGLLRGLNFFGRVKSPTYTLLEIYPFSSFNLYHFDLYRFADPIEWQESGFQEYFNARSIGLVEWPEKAAGMLPEPDLTIRLDLAGEGRLARLSGNTEEGRRCARKVMESYLLG